MKDGLRFESKTVLQTLLKHCNNVIVTCILVFINYTPITSCELERSFSSLQLTMNHLRSSMGEERLAALTLVAVRIRVCSEQFIRKYIPQNSRNLFKLYLLFD